MFLWLSRFCEVRFGRCNISLQRNNFFYRAASILNKLPPQFLALTSSIQLKTALKKVDVLQLMGVDDVK
ncbi:unnamed protein product [Cylicocyclus nassatus]|uniref:Uncharacterized protein n=1 Tax=Cylicocyclus nassatus TaxID=53992 RepID=A0AA36GWB6_CYLNA|nr:unnamed protein product [Cylicocyclus nassatus]